MFSAVAAAEILIGVAGPLSGQNAQFGEQMVRGAQAAVDKINGEGGINGELLGVVQADDGCDARRAVKAAQDFIARDVRFVVGHFCSGASIAAAEAYAKADIIMMSPSASNPKLTDEAGWNVFRLAARDDAQADVAAARIAAEVPNAKIAVVTDNSPGMASLVRRLTGSTQIVIKPGDKDLTAAVEAIRTSGATVLYLASAAQEAGILVGQLQDAGTTLPVYGPDTLLADVFWERGGNAAEGTKATFASDPLASPKAQSTVAVLAAAGVDNAGAVLPSYAAVEIFAAAAKAKSVNDGKAMADWLRSGSAAATVLGLIAFDARGDVAPPRIDWYRWSLGSYTKIQ
jgi:branched-chain amino acid transport system substrate-binding protein